MHRIRRSIRFLIIGSAAVAITGACASGGPRLMQLSPTALYERGIQSYRAGDYDRAIRALEALTLQYPTYPRIEKARYRLAGAYFQQEDYIKAATAYAQLANDFSDGRLADDARFKVCKSYQRLSPIIPRDQKYTRAAIDHCRSLLAMYPESEYAPEAREIIRALEDKLAKKLYVTGNFYFDRGAYDSAVIYYKDVVAVYPESEAAPKALMRIVEVYRKIGYTEDAESARERLLREYPESAAAERLAESSIASRD